MKRQDPKDRGEQLLSLVKWAIGQLRLEGYHLRTELLFDRSHHEKGNRSNRHRVKPRRL